MKRLALIIILPIFIILVNFQFLVFNEDFYQKEFTKLNINFPKENFQELFNFLKDNKQIESDFFNEKEKAHLIDVKDLIDKTRIIFYISLLATVILLFLNKKTLTKPFLYSGIILILIPIPFLIANFNSLFIKFHEISFSNNLWMLNPATDSLIKMFPEQFFKNFLRTIFIGSTIIGIILIITSFFLKPKKPN